MSDVLFIMILIVALLVLFGVVVLAQSRKAAEIRKENPGYPKGYWMSQGIGIGIAIGAGIGVALNNIAIGVGVGVAIGAAIGSGMEKRHKDEIRSILEVEKILDKQTLLIAAGIFMLGIVSYLVWFLLTR